MCNLRQKGIKNDFDIKIGRKLIKVKKLRFCLDHSLFHIRVAFHIIAFSGKSKVENINQEKRLINLIGGGEDGGY